MKLTLNEDVNIILSVINTKLRNNYHSLDDLCEDMSINKEKLLKVLGDADKVYNQDLNQFVSQSHES